VDPIFAVYKQSRCCIDRKLLPHCNSCTNGKGAATEAAVGTEAARATE